MPSRGPDGKPLSGGAKRKRAYEAKEARQRAARSAPGGSLASSSPAPPDAPDPDTVEYRKVGAPPLETTAELVTWAAKMIGATIWLIATDPEPDGPRMGRRRLITDSCAKLGMIRDKAAEQEKIKKAADAILKKRGQAKATGGQSLAGVAKPETARRGRTG